jgi:Ca-activated chloride channel family protein
MASPASLRVQCLTPLLLLACACGETLEPRASDETSVTEDFGDNYGEGRIGYKGASLSRTAALQGDQSTLGASGVSSAGSAPNGGGFAGGGAALPSGSSVGTFGGGTIGGGTIGGGTTVGVAPPSGNSAPYPGTYDAGIGSGPDASSIDAAPALDAQSPQPDAALDAELADVGPPRSLDASDGTRGPDAAQTVVDAQEPGVDAQLARDAASTWQPDATPQAGLVARPDAASPATKPDAQVGGADAAASAPVLPENPFQRTSESAASSFAIDVDTGSYTLSRASINAGHRPDPKSVRIEEFLNYFHFHYAQPKADVPFSLYTELGACPWNAERKLLLLGIQGQEVELKDQPPANLVFLIDVSGSMASPERLPLLKKGFRMLAAQLRAQDRVSIVTYAGRPAVVLTATPGDQKQTILAAISALESGGSTNGQGGIQKAYEIAQEHFIKDGNNRVLLATDGDFNVGLSQTSALVDFISEKRKTGVYLSVYGFGAAWNGGNYKDEVGEQLADHGDGVYFYIDSQEEARRAFLESVSGSLLTVAKDVKVQVEMNPLLVEAYRLIGYENRVITNAAFSNDKVDGGELGAGLSVTALFEIIPAGTSVQVPAPRPGSVPVLAGADAGAEEPAERFDPVQGENLVEVRVRYKEGLERRSALVRGRYTRSIERAQPSAKFHFAASVGELAMQLRGSQYLGVWRTRELLDQIAQTRPLDREGAIEELFELAKSVQALGTSR